MWDQQFYRTMSQLFDIEIIFSTFMNSCWVYYEFHLQFNRSNLLNILICHHSDVLNHFVWKKSKKFGVRKNMPNQMHHGPKATFRLKHLP